MRHTIKLNWHAAALAVLIGQLGACGTPSPTAAQANPQEVSAERKNILVGDKSEPPLPSLPPTITGKDIRQAQGPLEKGKAWIAALKHLTSLELRSDPTEVQKFLDIEEVTQPRLVRPGYSRLSVSYVPITFEAKSLEELGLKSLQYGVSRDEPDFELRQFSLYFAANTSCISAPKVMRQFGSKPERLPPSVVTFSPQKLASPEVPSPNSQVTPSAQIERGKFRYQLLPFGDTGSIFFSFDSQPCASSAFISLTRSTKP